MREQLDRVVAEMVDRGVHYDDAQREFERRFIAGSSPPATATSAAPPRCSACTATP